MRSITSANVNPIYYFIFIHFIRNELLRVPRYIENILWITRPHNFCQCAQSNIAMYFCLFLTHQYIFWRDKLFPMWGFLHNDEFNHKVSWRRSWRARWTGSSWSATKASIARMSPVASQSISPINCSTRMWDQSSFHSSHVLHIITLWLVLFVKLFGAFVINNKNEHRCFFKWMFRCSETCFWFRAAGHIDYLTQGRQSLDQRFRRLFLGGLELEVVQVVDIAYSGQVELVSYAQTWS